MIGQQNISGTSFRVAGDKKRCRHIIHNIRYDVGYRPVKFYLKQYSSVQERSQIVLAISVQGIRYRIYTRMKVEPAFWDRDAQRCLDTDLLCARVRKRVRDINENIESLLFEIDRKDRLLAERGDFLRADHIRSIIIKIVNPRKDNAEARPLEILRYLAEDYTAHLNNRGQKGASSSSQTYIMAVARLERFVRDTGFVINDFSCFNKTFYDKFKDYLIGYKFKKGDKELKYTSNTVMNTISVINNLTRKAYDMNLGGDTYYRGSCSILHEAAEKIYLSEKELSKLKRVKTLSESESQIRDMFLIASYTALRISDINGLNDATFSNDTIVLQQKKNQKQRLRPDFEGGRGSYI